VVPANTPIHAETGCPSQRAPQLYPSYLLHTLAHHTKDRLTTRLRTHKSRRAHHGARATACSTTATTRRALSNAAAPITPRWLLARTEANHHKRAVEASPRPTAEAADRGLDWTRPEPYDTRESIRRQQPDSQKSPRVSGRTSTRAEPAHHGTGAARGPSFERLETRHRRLLPQPGPPHDHSSEPRLETRTGARPRSAVSNDIGGDPACRDTAATRVPMPTKTWHAYDDVNRPAPQADRTVIFFESARIIPPLTPPGRNAPRNIQPKRQDRKPSTHSGTRKNPHDKPSAPARRKHTPNHTPRPAHIQFASANRSTRSESDMHYV